MKDFKLTFKWNSIYQGPFPMEKFQKMDPNAKIEIEKLINFKKMVTIETLIEDEEDPLEVAYEIGAYLQSIPRL